MKRVTGKRVSLLIIMAVMILMVTGCGSESKGDKQTSSGTVQESQSTSGSENQSSDNNEGQESDFDFSQAFDNVEVNGKKVPFPFTLNDLGEDFSVDSIVEMGDGTCGASLYYKEEMIADIYMNVKKKGDFDNNTKIYNFDLSRNSKQMIKINGIDCNSSKNDVCENFKEYNGKNEVTANIEEVKGKNLLAIFFEENGSIRSIYIKKGE